MDTFVAIARDFVLYGFASGMTLSMVILSCQAVKRALVAAS